MAKAKKATLDRNIEMPKRLIYIFSVKDLKSEEFHTPFFQNHPSLALRIFRTEVNRQHDQNMLYLHPAEFDLYYLGHMNLETGEIHNDIEKLSNGTAVKDTK